MSRTSSDNVNIKENKKLEKKRGNVEVNPFIATLESIKKELGIKQITPEQFWIMQRNVSKFYNFRTAFHCIFRFFRYYL
jgi:hypothetical protein